VVAISVSRELSYLLIGFGALLVFSGVLSTGLLIPAHGFRATFINVVPVPPPAIERCQGVLVPFPYTGSCPPDYNPLPSPLDVLPFLPITFLAFGGVTVLAAVFPRIRGRILLLPLSVGLFVTGQTSNVGWPGNQGWPINWFLYPISSPLGSTYFPVYIVVPAFLADWALFSLAAGIVLLSVLRGPALLHRCFAFLRERFSKR
jgi:hypothetical protein